MFREVSLETAAREQPRVLTVAGEQQLCAGFGIGRSVGAHDGGQYHRVMQRAFALEQWQQAVQR